MQNKPLLYGVVGFLVGGLLVGAGAVMFIKPANAEIPEHDHPSMAASLKGKTGDAFDKAFLNSMVEHHEGALEMTEQAVTDAKHDELKELSKNIVETQQQEIDKMKAWQQQWGYGSGESKSGHGGH